MPGGSHATVLDCMELVQAEAQVLPGRRDSEDGAMMRPAHLRAEPISPGSCIMSWRLIFKSGDACARPRMMVLRPSGPATCPLAQKMSFHSGAKARNSGVTRQ